MAAPEVAFEFYRGAHAGKMDEDDFAASLPEARARLLAITGDDVPERCADAWRHALCAIADRVGGQDESGRYKAVSAGSTSYTLSDSVAGAGDLDAVRPWLSGTGLLWRGVSDDA